MVTRKAAAIAIIVSPLAFSYYGCIPSSNFYSGRTLEENKLSVGVGADDIILNSTDKSVRDSKANPFAPSFMAAYGLPMRFEAGIRYYPLTFLEASLRHQLNPRTFDVIDASLNLHFAHLFGAYSYLKYGFTISKNLGGYEPYIHYSAYYFLGATDEFLPISFVSESTREFVNANRTIGFGIGLPFRAAKLIPEFDYQYLDRDRSHGAWHFGIGLRVYTNQGVTNE